MLEYLYMDNLFNIRHSLAHIMLMAVKEHFPHALPTIGPVIDNGFYYDIDFSKGDKLTENDLPKIEESMRKIISRELDFVKTTLNKDEALDHFKNNPYKQELINQIGETGEDITFYSTGNDFNDLCEGPHVKNTREIPVDCFKLDKLAGAYWRGDEKNAMLTRIYGIALSSKADLDKYILEQEEAKARDHRVLGKNLNLFTFSNIVGSGLPIWLPHGATIRRELERFVVDTELEWGYLHVNTPDIAKLDLYKQSGHYPYYKDSMYAPIKIDEDEFMLRPMTCPHHFQIFTDSPKSYRDLPMRIAELAKLYRYEASGELSGLVRVRGFCLADAHIICADKDQAKDEVKRALDLIEYVAKTLNLNQGEDFWYRLSLGDRADTEKYYKNDEAWGIGEQVLREVLVEKNCKYFEAEKEAAFYGPKIDIQMKDIRGKENTAFTVQYDFCMPDRFNLEYTNKDGEKARPIVVHRSSIGAIERIMAFLIEHYAGKFPLWLSPVQVYVIGINEEKHGAYSNEVFNKLRKSGIRVEIADFSKGFGKNVRHAKSNLFPYFIVIGDSEVSEGKVTIESRNGSKETLSVDEVISKLQEEIKAKTI